MRVLIQKVENRMGQGIKSIARHLAASEMESGAYTCPITLCTFSPLTQIFLFGFHFGLSVGRRSNFHRTVMSSVI